MKYEDYIAPLIGKTGKMLGTLINERLASHGIELTREQWVVLARIYYEKGLTQNELAHITERDKTTLARLMRKLEDKGYIYRRIARGDKRKRKVFLTREGEKCFAKSLPVMIATIERLQKGFTPGELETALSLIQKFKNNIIEELNKKTDG